MNPKRHGPLDERVSERRREPLPCRLPIVVNRLQVAFGWQDMHLHRFAIRGREYGVHQDGGVFFDTDAHQVLIGRLKLRRLERFTYEYEFGDGWVHGLRIEAALPIDPKRVYPVCIAGRRAAPPEDCGGPKAFMVKRSGYAVIGGANPRAS